MMFFMKSKIKSNIVFTIYHENVIHKFVIFGGLKCCKLFIFFTFNFDLHWGHKRHQIPEKTCWATGDTGEIVHNCMWS